MVNPIPSINLLQDENDRERLISVLIFHLILLLLLSWWVIPINTNMKSKQKSLLHLHKNLGCYNKETSLPRRHKDSRNNKINFKNSKEKSLSMILMLPTHIVEKQATERIIVLEK